MNDRKSTEDLALEAEIEQAKAQKRVSQLFNKTKYLPLQFQLEPLLVNRSDRPGTIDKGGESTKERDEYESVIPMAKKVIYNAKVKNRILQEIMQKIPGKSKDIQSKQNKLSFQSSSTMTDFQKFYLTKQSTLFSKAATITQGTLKSIPRTPFTNEYGRK